MDRARTGVVWYGDLMAFAAAGSVAGLVYGSGSYLAGLLSPGPAALVVFAPAWALLSFALADVAFVDLSSFAAGASSIASG